MTVLNLPHSLQFIRDISQKPMFPIKIATTEESELFSLVYPGRVGDFSSINKDREAGGLRGLAPLLV